MHLVQILLPVLRSGEGRGDAHHGTVARELTERFGGVTAHVRAPAEGAWVDPEGDVERDSIVILEVLTEELDRSWWRDYRSTLERRYEQEEVLIRAIPVERL